MAVIGLKDVKPSDVERFWRYVDKGAGDECWFWTGGGASKRGKAYGAFWVCSKTVGAHYFSHLIHNGGGVCPRTVMVCHTCDNKLCVNPAHLFLGTTQDNMDDMVRKGRQVRGERVSRGKLNRIQVKWIRRLHAKQGWTSKQLAVRYGVSITAICYILSGKNWKHV